VEANDDTLQRGTIYLFGDLDGAVRYADYYIAFDFTAGYQLYLLTPDHGGTRIGRPARA
jgi:hypothetical protein